jgi:sec-independent protein translocase protein TatB
MSAPGFWEIVFLAVLALLVFGPDKLPGFARTAGRVIAQLRREANATLDELKQSADFSEFDEVRGELRSVGRELRGATDVHGAGDPRPLRNRSGAAGAGPGSGPDQPAPFDPDAT